MAHGDLKVPPQNLEAERSVLGAMLIDNDAIGMAAEALDPSWFYEDAHQKIYMTILELYNNHKNLYLL